MTEQEGQDGQVNPHYLDNVMIVADDRAVQATEDIYADNGMKLVAKGKAINRELRERLISRKLRKPLEDCVEVANGLTGAQCARTAEELLDLHAPLRLLCSPKGFNPVKLLAESSFHSRLQSLLTIYCEHRPNKGQHAVTVALLGLGLAHRIQPALLDKAQVMVTACLAHDVGELYINPDYLAPGVQLGPQQWRHIAAHPVVAHRLLNDLPGPCRPAAALVLDHHERLDGFGYPHGKAGAAIAVGAQIVAVSEMLGGLLASGSANSLRQAEVAVKLIPGEFSRTIIDVISTVHQQLKGQAAQGPDQAAQQALQDAARIARMFGRIERVRTEFDDEFSEADQVYQALVLAGRERFERIRRAWSSTGLDAHPPELLPQLEISQDGEVGVEVAMILREIIWRLRELERELRVRVQNQAPAQLPLLDRFFARLGGKEAPQGGRVAAADPA